MIGGKVREMIKASTATSIVSQTSQNGPPLLVGVLQLLQSPTTIAPHKLWADAFAVDSVNSYSLATLAGPRGDWGILASKSREVLSGGKFTWPCVGIEA